MEKGQEETEWEVLVRLTGSTNSIKTTASFLLPLGMTLWLGRRNVVTCTLNIGYCRSFRLSHFETIR